MQTQSKLLAVSGKIKLMLFDSIIFCFHALQTDEKFKDLYTYIQHACRFGQPDMVNPNLVRDRLAGIPPPDALNKGDVKVGRTKNSLISLLESGKGKGTQFKV